MEFCLQVGLIVWCVVDEYYCSETTTAQACLGYVSVGRHRVTRHQLRANQLKRALQWLLGLLCAHIFLCIWNELYKYVAINKL